MLAFDDALAEADAMDAYEAQHPKCEVCQDYGCSHGPEAICFCGLDPMVPVEPDKTPIHLGRCAVEWELGPLPPWAEAVALAVSGVVP